MDGSGREGGGMRQQEAGEEILGGGREGWTLSQNPFKRQHHNCTSLGE